MATVCTFEKFHWTFKYFNFEVLHDILKNQNECQLTSTFFSRISLQNHICLVVCVISISDVWFFLRKSYYMWNSKLCVSIDVHFSVQHVKCQKLCQKIHNVWQVVHDWCPRKQYGGAICKLEIQENGQGHWKHVHLIAPTGGVSHKLE